jgi:hypothetical protein
VSVLSSTQMGVPSLCTTAFFPLLLSPLLFFPLLYSTLLYSTLLFLPSYLSFFPASTPSFLPSFLHPHLPICHVLSRTVSSLLSIRFLLPYCVSSPPYSPFCPSLLFSFSFSFCPSFLIVNHHCSHNSNYFKSKILVFHI